MLIGPMHFIQTSAPSHPTAGPSSAGEGPEFFHEQAQRTARWWASASHLDLTQTRQRVRLLPTLRARGVDAPAHPGRSLRADVSVELSDDRSDVVLSTNASAGMGSKGGKGVEVADWVVALEKKDAFRVTRSSSGARDGGERDVRWDLNIKTSALLNGQKARARCRGPHARRLRFRDASQPLILRSAAEQPVLRSSCVPQLNLAFSASPTLGTSSVQCRMPVRDGLFVSAAYDTSNLRRLERDRLTVGFEQSLGVSTIVSGEYSFGDASATLTATRVVDPVNILQVRELAAIPMR